MEDDNNWVPSHPINAEELEDYESQNPFEPQSTQSNNRNSDNSSKSSDIGIEGFISDDTIQGRIAREMYGRSKEKAQGFVNLYANIDFVRPYFDVEPREVLGRLEIYFPWILQLILIFSTFIFRLIYSLVPYRKRDKYLGDEYALEPLETKPDLYGPLMLCFTLSSILLLGLKLQDEGLDGSNLEEGTLLSTALFVCFAFWFISSLVYYFIGFVFNSTSSFLEILSISVGIFLTN